MAPRKMSNIVKAKEDIDGGCCSISVFRGGVFRKFGRNSIYQEWANRSSDLPLELVCTRLYLMRIDSEKPRFVGSEIHR